MKIAVVAPDPVPETFGGTERAVADLTTAIAERTPHDAELVKLPVDETTLPGLLDAYERFSLLDLSDFDRVITVKYPAWMVDHPHKIVYLFHPLRGFYDTWPTLGLPLEVPNPADHTYAMMHLMRQAHHRGAYDEFFERWHNALAALGPDHPDFAFPSPFARLAVRWLDHIALDPEHVERYVALSRTVANRPDYFPARIAPAVAHLPGALAQAAPTHRDRPYFFTASRLDGPKRHTLLIDAMAHVDADIDLLIAGTGPLRDELAARAAHDPRISLLGFVPDDDLPGLYAGARAVPFVPADEDLGLITLEALSQGTPVVTCTDAGGPAEQVKDRVTGFVTPPVPAAIGEALTTLAADPDLAARLGAAGRQRANLVTWDTVIDAVLGEDRYDTAEQAKRQAAEIEAARESTDPDRVVVLSTFTIDDPGHGGQIRARNLYGALARQRPVELVALVDAGVLPSRTEIAPGLVQTVVSRSAAHQREIETTSRAMRIPMSDLLAGSAIDLTPAYLQAVRIAAAGASAIVLAEPYLRPAIDRLELAIPVLYDAYNVETELKAGAYPNSELGRTLLAQVAEVERRAVAEAAMITTCSEADAAALAALAGRDRNAFVVVSNGTTIPDAVPSAAERRERSRRWRHRYWTAGSQHAVPRHLAVFFGSWHPPNLDAAEFLIEIAPLLPDVLILSVGHHGAAFTNWILPPNLVFPGKVPTGAKDRLLAVADVALNPMRIGSGTNLKLLEMLGAGVPVVSTPFGTRGIDVVDGQHLRLAEPDGFAAAVTQVLSDPVGSARRAAAARQLVADRYSWAALGDRLADAVADIAPRTTRK